METETNTVDVDRTTCPTVAAISTPTKNGHRFLYVDVQQLQSLADKIADEFGVTAHV